MSNTALMRRGDLGDADLTRLLVEKYEVRKSSTRINGHAIFSHGVLALTCFLCRFNDRLGSAKKVLDRTGGLEYGSE